MTEDNDPHVLIHEELPEEHSDPLIRFLHRIIRIAIRVLAVLMVLVIIWGIGDVIYVLYQRLGTPPSSCSISTIFSRRSAPSWRC
ncbi:phosphate-starvation-inducible PsiE family protein [Marinobacterium aestuariivivens]|uniref:Phosphate-starvation-inducible PsiE family protein n=1 Tax=Marinobacterium aestuariivivens TaxID=1698799 RepID=A0ABW2A467_9GAMM